MDNRLSTIAIVYLSGLLQGISLILYPAAGPIFKSEAFHQLSSGQYGLLFTPQIILAIITSFSAARLASKWRMKRVLQAGLLANMLAMLLFAGSNWGIGQGLASYAMLLLGTACLGAGFGLTISAVNPYAYSFFPGKEASAVTGLHILLGLGTSISALVLNLFVQVNVWWGAGLFTGALFLLLWVWSIPVSMSLAVEGKEAGAGQKKKIPGRLWLFFLIVFLYGACEATFGNFAPIYLEEEAGLSSTIAALGLSLFWGAIAGGRLLFTVAALRYNLRIFHVMVPVLVAVVFFSMPFLNGPEANYAALILAGLGLSFYFPYSISLASDEFPALATTVSGMLVAAIQLGTGVSSNIIGFLGEELSLSAVIQSSSLYALIMAGLAGYLFLTRQPIKGRQLQNT